MEDDKKRKTAFKVREKGLIKKVRELSILCDISACAIIYNPYDDEPTVWPSTLEVQQTISKFNSMSEMEKNDRSVDLTTFLKQRIVKVDAQIKKQQIRNRESHLTLMMIDGMFIGKEMLQTLALSDLDDLRSKVEDKLAEINKRIENCSTSHHTQLTPSNSLMSITPQEIKPLLPITTLLPTPTMQIPMSKAPQQVPPFSLPNVPKSLDFLGLEQVSSPLPETLDHVTPNDDMPQSMLKKQLHNELPHGFNFSADQPLYDMVYNQGQKNHNNKAQASDSTMAFPNASCGPSTTYLEPNPYFY